MITKRKRPAKESRSTSSDIMAFGYASNIYNDKVLAQKIEDGAFLVPWQSNTDYSHRMFDRYDIRHLLDHVEEFGAQQITQQLGNDWRDPTDIECDQERYVDLDSEEELLFDMDDAEDREAHLAEKKRRRSRATTGHMYHYDYGSTSPPSIPLTIAERSANIQQVAQEFNIPTSSTMIVPTNDDNSSSDGPTDKESPGLAFIVETAQIIVGRAQTGSQPANVCEIQFQVRHSHDRRYDFLNKQHVYYPFYQHVRRHLESNYQPPPPQQRTPLIKKQDIKRIGGLVDYGSSSSSDEDEDGEGQQQQQQQCGNQTTQNIPSDVKETIDKMAASVAKVGLDLEQKIRHLRSQDPRFAFLQPHHPHHSYYQKQLGLRLKR
ncbi:alternative splicing regulator-domain-containing protein [Absidia repens]|uniref:Alternative splicing regulator-domain-containing protein n=1 Tax=Absidia repens TaxID=90262 RepID=A0A1X2IDM4_9FUNG|nr:alternative splicing regulator-domain-containing protein [Absidia repens]